MSMKSRPSHVVYIDFNVELVNLFRCVTERSHVLPGKRGIAKKAG